MTQMLLFDSVSSASGTAGSLGIDTAVAPIVSVSPAAPPASATANKSLRGSSTPAANGADAPETHVRGLNRMGDLARLVLLRHDLMAEQRKQGRSGRRAK